MVRQEGAISASQFILAYVAFVIGLAWLAVAIRRPGVFYVALAAIFAIPWLDDAFVPYDDEAVVRGALGLPATAQVGRSSHNKSPACWAEGRNIAVPIEFPAPDFAKFTQSGVDPARFADAVARFDGIAADKVMVAPGALDWRKVDVRYSRGGLGTEWPIEHASYYPGYVCAVLTHENGARAYTVRGCDPLDPATMRGAAGSVVLTRRPDASGVYAAINFSSNGPACRNRVRHFVNRVVGLSDPP